MASAWSKWLWGGLGWAVGGPIGAVVGFALGALSEGAVESTSNNGTSTAPGDFGVSFLVLCAAVMKADGRLLKSELEYVRRFFIMHFGAEAAAKRILLFREILKQDYDIAPVCAQIRMNMDYQSRVQLIHLLFGLAHVDGSIHPSEESVIKGISEGLGVEYVDYESVRSSFVKGNDLGWAYKVLETKELASNDELKKAYRTMAAKHHPDKVHHLGEEFQKSAQERFKQINEAWELIKKQRGIS